MCPWETTTGLPSTNLRGTRPERTRVEDFKLSKQEQQLADQYSLRSARFTVPRQQWRDIFACLKEGLSRVLM
jgi:hypothetical protein